MAKSKRKGARKPKIGETIAINAPKIDKSNNGRKRKKQSTDEKMSLSTNSQDYAGGLDLPEKIKQREYESTGQFFRRLDRLVAKAKVEASMGSRFDYDVVQREKKQQQGSKGDNRKLIGKKARKNNNSLDDEIERFNKRRKRRY